MNSNKSNRIPFPHPGETIREDFLKPLKMSVNRLARASRVNGRRGITAKTVLRLARYFNTAPKFWVNLQTSYDLALAAKSKAEEIARTVHPRHAA